MPIKGATKQSGNTNAPTQQARPPAGKHVADSRDRGDPLPSPDKGVPGHDNVIPWKPVDNGHKPFKI